MNLTDVVFYGWYQILEKTVYSQGSEGGAFGAKAHSFFITFLFHGINISTILSFLLIVYFNYNLSIYYSLSLALVTFAVGYLIYFKRKRANRIITSNIKGPKVFLFVLISIIYTIASIYFMFKVGTYIRYR